MDLKEKTQAGLTFRWMGPKPIGYLGEYIYVYETEQIANEWGARNPTSTQAYTPSESELKRMAVLEVAGGEWCDVQDASVHSGFSAAIVNVAGVGHICVYREYKCFYLEPEVQREQPY